jgi:hypothetical protein
MQNVTYYHDDVASFRLFIWASGNPPHVDVLFNLSIPALMHGTLTGSRPPVSLTCVFLRKYIDDAFAANALVTANEELLVDSQTFRCVRDARSMHDVMFRTPNIQCNSGAIGVDCQFFRTRTGAGIRVELAMCVETAETNGSCCGGGPRHSPLFGPNRGIGRKGV